MRPLLFALLATTAWVLSPLSAQTTINISNSGFESPVQSVSPYYTSDGATGWTRTNSSIPAGTFAPGLLPQTLTPSPIAGAQVGYADGFGGLQQILTDTFAANQLYTYTVYIGYRSDALDSAPQGTGAITLGHFDTSTFTPFSTQTATVSRGNFDFVTGSFQTTAGALGKPIALQLTSTASHQVLFDQVQLTFTAVPEPAAFAGTLGAAVLGIAWWCRRKASGTAPSTVPRVGKYHASD